MHGHLNWNHWLLFMLHNKKMASLTHSFVERNVTKVSTFRVASLIVVTSIIKLIIHCFWLASCSFSLLIHVYCGFACDNLAGERLWNGIFLDLCGLLKGWFSQRRSRSRCRNQKHTEIRSSENQTDGVGRRTLILIVVKLNCGSRK